MSTFLILFFLAAFYVLSAFPLMRIAQSTDDHRDDAWMAWVPVANSILLCRIARVSAWWCLLFLLWFIGLFLTVVLWIRVGSRFHRTGLGWLAGLLPVIGAWVLAFNVETEAA